MSTDRELLERARDALDMIIKWDEQGFVLNDAHICPAKDVRVDIDAHLKEPAPAEPPPSFDDALKVTRGCLDYLGGFHGAELEAFHAGIKTVVSALTSVSEKGFTSHTNALRCMGDAQPVEPAPVYHLRSYGDVSEADLKAYTERSAPSQDERKALAEEYKMRLMTYAAEAHTFNSLNVVVSLSVALDELDRLAALPQPVETGGHYTIAHDGFEGDVIGHYTTREGKQGVVLQQTGTRVVHVYGIKWLTQPNGDKS